MTNAQTVDEYIAGFPADLQPRLHQFRELSKTQAPDAVEGLKWGEPAYSSDTILFMWGAFKQHANFVFTPSTKEAFADELASFETGKGSVKVPHNAPVPDDLLARMIQHRIREFEEQGVLWR